MEPIPQCVCCRQPDARHVVAEMYVCDHCFDETRRRALITIIDREIEAQIRGDAGEPPRGFLGKPHLNPRSGPRLRLPRPGPKQDTINTGG